MFLNERKTNSLNKWKTSTIVVSYLLVVVTTFYALGVGWKTTGDAGSASPDTALSLWTDKAKAKDKLVSYMNAITEEGGADYIPPENRIAVFDLDGTLFCETDPNYFDYTLLVYRVLEDPDYKDKASDFEKETAEKIVTLNETGKAAKGLEVDHGKAVASAFRGMTVGEFNDYIQKFKQLPMPSYDVMKAARAGSSQCCKSWTICRRMTSQSISSAAPIGSSCAGLFTILP